MKCFEKDWVGHIDHKKAVNTKFYNSNQTKAFCCFIGWSAVSTKHKVSAGTKQPEKISHQWNLESCFSYFYILNASLWKLLEQK